MIYMEFLVVSLIGWISRANNNESEIRAKSLVLRH